MNLSSSARAAIVGLISALLSVSASSQGLPAGVTPQMVQQVQNMTPAQQQALAKQYGINLPQTQGTSSSGGDGLGAAGEPLEQASGDNESADKETQPDDLAAAVAVRDGEEARGGAEHHGLLIVDLPAGLVGELVLERLRKINHDDQRANGQLRIVTVDEGVEFSIKPVFKDLT